MKTLEFNAEFLVFYRWGDNLDPRLNNVKFCLKGFSSYTVHSL